MPRSWTTRGMPYSNRGIKPLLQLIAVAQASCLQIPLLFPLITLAHGTANQASSSGRPIHARAFCMLVTILMPCSPAMIDDLGEIKGVGLWLICWASSQVGNRRYPRNR